MRGRKLYVGLDGVVKESVNDPHVGPDLVAWLEKNFPPKCKALNDEPQAYAWYCAKHELAQSLINMAKRKNDQPTTEVEV